MSRIPALLLSALIALTPVIVALCADGCIDVDASRLVEVVETCGHGDVSSDAPALSAAVCATAQADFVVVEVRVIGPALAPSLSVSVSAAQLLHLPAHERYLQHQPPPPPAGLVLRI